MMMHYDRSTVTGYRKKDNGKLEKMAIEDFIHQRQQDPILMACKRNHRMAGCDVYDVDTVKAFDRWIDDVQAFFVPNRAHVPEYEW